VHCAAAKKKKIKLTWSHIVTKESMTVVTTRPQRKRTTRNIGIMDLGKEMWTAGFRYSYRKMEAATQDRAGWSRVLCDPRAPTGMGKSGHLTLPLEML